MRLYLPDSWLDAPARLDKAGVPGAERRRLSKGRIALELLDRVRAEGLPSGVVAADSGYDIPPFPSLTWDGYSWAGGIRLPSWAGFQPRRGP